MLCDDLIFFSRVAGTARAAGLVVKQVRTATAMVDALPYLVDYPYGCTEQTLNRFVPAVIARKVLIDMGVDLAAVKEKRTNLNAQEIGDPQKRASQWKELRWSDKNPVFDDAEHKMIVKVGLERITSMQNRDGGWGWFSGDREYSYPHTTAVVVHGLQVAKAADLAIIPGVLENGVAWLKSYEAGEVRRIQRWNDKKPPNDSKKQADNTDALVRMILADQSMGRAIYSVRKRVGLHEQCTIYFE